MLLLSNPDTINFFIGAGEALTRHVLMRDYTPEGDTYHIGLNIKKEPFPLVKIGLLVTGRTGRWHATKCIYDDRDLRVYTDRHSPLEPLPHKRGTPPKIDRYELLWSPLSLDYGRVARLIIKRAPGATYRVRVHTDRINQRPTPVIAELEITPKQETGNG